MKLSAIFKIFQKGSKEASKLKGKEGKPAFAWPPGVRIGVYGHANSGKTVYFTVLNEECKISKDVQISVTDNATAGEFLSNYRLLWGLGASVDTGTIVDRRGEKKFPEPTIGDKVLQFNALVDRSKKFPVVTYDYNGKAVSISDRIDLKDKVADFFIGCDGIIFFFDPKTMAAELQCQEHVASFASMLERLAPLHSRLPLPIALVVTKADILPGFTGENQTILIPPENENYLAEDFEVFLDKILSGNKVASDSNWAGSVRNVLVKLREFLKIVVGRTLDFQIFFVSNTGQTPEKIGTDVGRSIYAPPAKIHPVGVREPFYWILKSISRSRKISGFRKVAKFVAALSIIWIIVFSIPFLFHYFYLLSGAQKAEREILASARASASGLSPADRQRIIDEYRDYARAWTVRTFFEDYILPARQLYTVYETMNVGSATEKMNEAIKELTAIVKSPNRWPKLNPINDSLDESPDIRAFVAEMEAFIITDTTSALYTRRKRVLNYLDFFRESIRRPSDSAFAKIMQLVNYNLDTYPNDLSAEEKDLMGALSTYCSSKKEQKVQTATAQAARGEFDKVIEDVNGNPDPAFRFEEAVSELQAILSGLDAAVDRDKIQMINRYLNDVKRWKNTRQEFVCKIISLPTGAHLHIEVTDDKDSPVWSQSEQLKIGQLFKDATLKIKWKIGDDIHISIDLEDHECGWGRNASETIAITDDYAIFKMEEGISFDNIGKKAKVSLAPSPKEILPTLK
jgi:GTPase SAR1 family protein